MHQPIEINYESNLVKYAQKELEIMGMLDTGDSYDQAMASHILELISVFSSQGHSGFSASYLTTCVQKLMRFSPLSPLMGDDSEWDQVGPNHFQNKRCASVFKEDGVTYDTEGKVFRRPDGVTFLSKDSWVKIKFPYMPTKEIVDVD